MRKKKKLKEQKERANIFERYIGIVSESIAELADEKVEEITEAFMKMIQKPELQAEINQLDKEDEKYHSTGFHEDELDDYNEAGTDE